METKQLYIISEDEYMGFGPGMSAFIGTRRELLEHLNRITDENRADDLELGDGRTVNDLTDEELIQLFRDSNGDGQTYKQVWSVLEGKKVL